jgi:hypothetical protein
MAATSSSTAAGGDALPPLVVAFHVGLLPDQKKLHLGADVLKKLENIDAKDFAARFNKLVKDAGVPKVTLSDVQMRMQGDGKGADGKAGVVGGHALVARPAAAAESGEWLSFFARGGPGGAPAVAAVACALALAGLGFVAARRGQLSGDAWRSAVGERTKWAWTQLESVASRLRRAGRRATTGMKDGYEAIPSPKEEDEEACGGGGAKKEDQSGEEKTVGVNGAAEGEEDEHSL